MSFAAGYLIASRRGGSYPDRPSPGTAQITGGGFGAVLLILVGSLVVTGALFGLVGS